MKQKRLDKGLVGGVIILLLISTIAPFAGAQIKKIGTIQEIILKVQTEPTTEESISLPIRPLNDNTISPEETQRKIISNLDTVLVDVRTFEEYKSNHIKGAVLITFSDCDSCFLSRLENYRNHEIIVYSNSGDRGEKACGFLKLNDFKEVYNLQDGIDSWIEKEFSVVSSDLNLKEDKCDCAYIEVGETRYYLMTSFPPRPPELDNPEPMGTFDDPPSEFSWKDFNGGDYTTPAKSQGSCGSCWDFGAVSALEGVINIAYDDPDMDLDLSEQYVLSCLPSAGSCNGGWSDLAFYYIMSQSSQGNNVNGIIPEWCMPYQAVDWIPCDDKCDDWMDHLWEISGYGEWSLNGDDPSDRGFLKAKLIEKGPLVVYLTVTSGFSSWGNTHHNPNDYFPDPGPVGYINHAVCLVGYKDDVNIDNGGYWICKNSWGTGFGYNGFFNIEYGALRIDDNAIYCEVPGPIYVADFIWVPQHPRTSESIQFFDNSGGGITSRYWDFGDGGHSSLINPYYIYDNPGTYDVTLRIYVDGEQVDSITKKVEVKNNWEPYAIATPEHYAGDVATVAFSGIDSWDPDGTIVSYHWDFNDGDTSDEMNPSHTFPGDRYYDVTLTVTDNNDAQGIDHCNIYIDATTPPVTTLELVGSLGNNGWYKGYQVKVILTATDWSGVKETYYRLDNGNWKIYSDPLIIYSNGVTLVDYYSVDIYNNVEDVHTDPVKLDGKPPVTDFSLSGELEGEWYISPVEVTLEADDTVSGVEAIKFSINNGPWAKFDAPFSISNDGSPLKLEYHATDKAGNRDITHSVDLYLEVDPPVTPCKLEGEKLQGWFSSPVNITLSAVDLGWGVDSTYYKMDNENWVTYSSSFTVSEQGEHTISYYSIDNYGRIEETKSDTFSINYGEAPYKPSKPSGPTQGGPGEEYTYRSSTVDPEGNQIWYMWDWGDGNMSDWLGPYVSGETCEASYVWSSKGSYEVKVKAKDEYGLESPWSDPLPISMPKNKPFNFNFNLLGWLFDRFPNAFPILRHLMGL